MKRADNDAEFMLLNEVAELTRQSPGTLRWLRHQGLGPPCVKIGRRLVFRRSAVLAWISQLEQEQAGAEGQARDLSLAGRQKGRTT
jgi:predicted DNA-binding transcriptional regulator AlpA